MIRRTSKQTSRAKSKTQWRIRLISCVQIKADDKYVAMMEMDNGDDSVKCAWTRKSDSRDVMIKLMRLGAKLHLNILVGIQPRPTKLPRFNFLFRSYNKYRLCLPSIAMFNHSRTVMIIFCCLIVEVNESLQ